MLNPNASSSSISDASQIRYQKAVRQISKLIGMNNTIKRDADNFRIMCENLQNQNRQLFQKYQELNNQRRQFDERIKNYQMRVREIQSINQNLKKQQQNQLNPVQIESERLKHHQQITILNQKLNQQGNTIMNLQQNMAQLQKINKDIKENHQKLQEELKSYKEPKEYKVVSAAISVNDCLKCQQLRTRLQQAVQFRSVLQDQIIQIKKKQLQTMYEPMVVNLSYRGGKDHVIHSLEQRIRNTQQREKKKNIEVYKLKQKLQRLQNQLKRYKDKQKLLQTTTINKQA